MGVQLISACALNQTSYLRETTLVQENSLVCWVFFQIGTFFYKKKKKDIKNKYQREEIITILF